MTDTNPKTTINYEPRGDRVLVRRLPRPAPQEGEVIIPNSQQKELDEGIVVAVGPGLRNRVTWQIDPVDLEPGDHVCFGEFAGSDVEVDGQTYLSMRDDEIHGRRAGVIQEFQKFCGDNFNPTLDSAGEPVCVAKPAPAPPAPPTAKP